jgi:ATP-dependent Clp protease ATP-binding subunit ClpC
VGFGTSAPPSVTDHADATRVLDAARPHFRPELWNRFDEALVFAPLSEDDVARIARLQLTRSSQRLLEERGISFTCEPEVIELLIRSGGYDREMGARPMRRTIERLVEGPIAEQILRGEVEGPAELEVLVDGDAIVVRHVSTD